MNEKRNLGNLVLINGAIMVGVAIPHLIDDFLFDIPEEFGLTNIQAQVLAGIFSVLLIAVFSLAARGRRWGYFGTAFLGGFLALAGILKHVPLMLRPGPYWSGLFSEILIGVLIVSGISLLIVSILALKDAGRRSSTGSGQLGDN
jgi:hypothetical protein